MDVEHEAKRLLIIIYGRYRSEITRTQYTRLRARRTKVERDAVIAKALELGYITEEKRINANSAYCTTTICYRVTKKGRELCEYSGVKRMNRVKATKTAK